MFNIKIVSKEERHIEQLEAENAELLEQVKEQGDALCELAELLEEVFNDG